jgi:hypothetical protein
VLAEWIQFPPGIVLTFRVVHGRRDRLEPQLVEARLSAAPDSRKRSIVLGALNNLCRTRFRYLHARRACHPIAFSKILGVLGPLCYCSRLFSRIRTNNHRARTLIIQVR